MPTGEPPLTDRELRIVRGMLDEYEYRRRLREGRHHLFGDFRVTIAVLGGIAVFMVQVAELWLLASGRR